MTMYYVGQKIIVGYMSLKNTLFQKPTFEWVWRHDNVPVVCHSFIVSEAHI